MTDRVWRHRFVQALFEILRNETGLSPDSCYELAFGEVETACGERQATGDASAPPEDAARIAYDRLRTTQV